MSSNEKRLRGGETDSSSSSIRRIGSTITMPRPLPPPMTSSPTSTSLTTTTSPSSPSSIPLRRSHSSLHKMPSSSGGGAMGGSSSQASLVPQQRYLEVPDAASMMSTHQRRTPSSASLLFGSYSMASSTPTPPISSNSRRLAGNIPGAVIKVKSSSPLLNRNLDTLTIPRSPASRRAALKAKASHNSPTNPIQIEARFPQDLSYKQSKKRHSVESLSGSCKATYFLNLILNVLSFCEMRLIEPLFELFIVSL